MLVVVARLQGVNQCCFKAATLFAILRRVGDEIQIACAVTSGIKRVGSAASVSRPQIVALGEAKAWARATCDAPNAILLHSIERRIPLWKHIKKLSAASRSPQSAFRIPQSGIKSSVYFCSRYFICFVSALLLLSGRSLIVPAN